MTEIQDIQMSYEGLVEAGREARKQADNMQWAEGDLALQVDALPAHERPRDGDGLFIEDEAKTLKRYADDIDIPFNSIRKYRRVAEVWPTDRRLSMVTWGVHEALASQEDRFALIKPGMTVLAARELVRKRTAGQAGKPNWHELLGWVGDYLTKAEKRLDKFDAEVSEEDLATYKRPAAVRKLRDKAGTFAERAESVAERLREIEEG